MSINRLRVALGLGNYAVSDKHVIQSRIDQIQWYHEFDFGNGLRTRDLTPDAPSHRRLWKFINEELDKIDLDGKSVLDIGCWDGFWSFYAESKGARVTATDDVSQNWAGENGFKLAHELLGSEIEYDLSRSVYELSALERKFDVIFFIGVYYHLLDPLYALAQIRHCCHEHTILIIEGDVLVGYPADDVAVFRADLNTGSRYVPSPTALRSLLALTYFAVEYEAMLDHFALIGEEIPPDAGGRVNRVLYVCKPQTMHNRFHWYKPPFGLAQFDTRWKSA